MGSNGIPKEGKAELEARVVAFNQKNLAKTDVSYHVRFRGRFCYLERLDYGCLSPIFRLTYSGDLNDLDCAIYKWSTESYDANEWLFPGSGKLDGTIEGAMRAGLEAYPA